jgi:hypothetical protein
MTPSDKALTDDYVRRGVLDCNKQPIHLPTACPQASICWAGIRGRSPKLGAFAAELSAPYIGERYNEGRLLIVLQNLRNYGGFDLGPHAKKGMRCLGDAAKEGFRRGLRKLFRGDSYPGTFVWHKAVSYAACWLEAQGLLHAKYTQQGDVATETLHTAMDLVAIVQHVKCSPDDGRRSTPSEEMWKECGPHLLIHELSILRPLRLIVLGTSKNAPALAAHVLSGTPGGVREQFATTGNRRLTVRYEQRAENWGNAALLIVPHPATAGGKSLVLLKTVRQVLACN